MTAHNRAFPEQPGSKSMVAHPFRWVAKHMVEYPFRRVPKHTAVFLCARTIG